MTKLLTTLAVVGAEHREPRRAADGDRDRADGAAAGHAAAVSRTLQISPLWALITPARSTSNPFSVA